LDTTKNYHQEMS